MEAISSQVALLRGHFAGSVSWGIHPTCGVQLSWQKGIAMNPRLWQPFRVATGVLQWAFCLNHVIGSLGDWFHLRACVRKPIVLTVAVKSPPCDQRLLSKISHYIVEWDTDCEYLQSYGVRSDKVSVIPPPVDTTRFRACSPPPDRFTVAFASSPENSISLESRGVDLLLDIAEMRPDFEILLVWRPWGDSEKTIREWIDRRRLRNVRIVSGVSHDMEQIYNRSHVVVALYRDPSMTKSVPNSLIEGLACGRPIVTTKVIGVGANVEKASAGYAVIPDRDAIVDALDKLNSNWHDASLNARRFAEKHFSVDRYIQSHNALYQQLL